MLLARHGRKHNIMPSKVNYRANIWTLKNIGCTHILASTATGSLQEHIKPGDLLVLDNFIDRTTKRMQTFYDGESDHPIGISHLQMEPSFCLRTRNVLIKTAKELGIPIHEHGTVVTIEGPRFSSKAESLMFKQWGGDVINMTSVPEVILAKELGICYAAIAMATDYDCWRDCGEHVNATDVIETFKKNAIKITTILKATVTNIAKDGDWTDTINDLKVIKLFIICIFFFFYYYEF